MKYIFLSALLIGSCHAQTVQQKIDGLIKQTLPHATVGVLIKDAQTGDIIYKHNADKLLSPASNTKMLTAAAALYYLGPDYRYITSLFKDNHNVYIKFTGAPSLTTDDLKQLLQKLSPSGVKSIPGNVILDTSRFKPPYHSGGDSYDDLGWYYSAPSTTVILNGNAVGYSATTTKLGSPIHIKPDNSNKVINVINNVITVSKEQEKYHCELNIETNTDNILQLYGCLPQEKNVKKLKLAIPNPTLYAKQLVKSTLQENHVLLKGNVVEGRVPTQAKLIATHASDSLTKLLTHMLEESDNLYADSVTKLLAYSLTGQGTYKQGAFAIKKIIAEHSHLDMQQIELGDGAGNRYNLITPEQLVVFLTDIYQDEKIKPIFLSALPRMGVSGTLKDRMKKTSLANHVFAKTGSMHDISALSGYLTTPEGKTLIFSIISNGINGDYSKAKTLEEKVLLAVL